MSNKELKVVEMTAKAGMIGLSGYLIYIVARW